LDKGDENARRNVLPTGSANIARTTPRTTLRGFAKNANRLRVRLPRPTRKNRLARKIDKVFSPTEIEYSMCGETLPNNTLKT